LNPKLSIQDCKTSCDSAFVAGDGLIGSFVSSQLQSAGYEVLTIGRQGLLSLVNNTYPHSPWSLYRPFTVFVYAAGSTDIAKAEEAGEVDIAGHLATFEASFSFFLRHRADISYAFLISSAGTMYGSNSDPFREGFSESDELKPISVYGRRNVTIEERFLSEPSRAVCKCSLRVANPFHPLQSISNRKGLLVSAIKAAMEKRTITLVANGCTVRNYFPLEVLAHAILAMIRKNQSELYLKHEVLNCGLSINLTSSECINLLGEYMLQKPKILMDSYIPEYEVMNAALNCSRLARLLTKASNPDLLDLGIELLRNRVEKLVRSCQQI
jgi:UDP-glucose 4-epimerase